jgi:type VI secretion system protein ImpC
VDRDDIDAAMEKLRVEVELPVAGAIRFRELEDFHPDRLYASLDFFAKLRQARDEAGSPGPPRAPLPPPRPCAVEPSLGLNGLLEQAMEETASRSEERPAETRDDFQAWLKEQVAPHLEPGEDPHLAERRVLVDRAASVQMRALMHFPSFQNTEAAWRALFFLLRRLETNELLKVHLVDISKQELARDLEAVEDFRDSGIYQLLAGDRPWAVLAGDYTFGPGGDDCGLLARLGLVASRVGAPFLARGASELIGCASLADTPDYRDWDPATTEEWETLRRLPVASWIGLAMPRFLLRLPYGKATEACENFALEEMPSGVEHERYLWGNPAFACAALLGASFSAHGWNMRPGTHLNLDRMPLDIRDRDGEPAAQPCAEVLMSEHGAERIMERGIMPLASLKESDEVRLVRFQSIAYPAAALAGPWAARRGASNN